MTPSRPASNTILLCILGAGLIVRIAAVVLFQTPLFSDDLDYIALGKSIAHGGPYELEGHATTYRTPGYPLLLALSFSVFGESLVPVRIGQACADLLSCLLVFAIGKKLFGERVGLLAAGIFALFPIQILYVSVVMTETIFTTLLLLYLYLCTEDTFSWKRCVAAGIILGAGTLVRPILLLMPAAIVAMRWLDGWKWTENLNALAITMAVAGLIMSPWLIRNELEFGKLTLTSNTGVNFWMGAHEGASGSYSYPPGNPLTFVSDEFERSDLGMRLGMKFIRDHPLEYLGVTAKKWAHFWSVDYWLLLCLHFQPDFRDAPRAAVVWARFPLRDVAAIHLPFAAVVLLTTFGFCCRAAEDSKGVLALLIPLAYWILAHLAFLANARYRFPIVPLLMIGGAYGADLILRGAAVKTRARTIAFWLLAAVFVGGWTAERVLILKGASTNAPEAPAQSTLRALKRVNRS